MHDGVCKSGFSFSAKLSLEHVKRLRRTPTLPQAELGAVKSFMLSRRKNSKERAGTERKKQEIARLARSENIPQDCTGTFFSVGWHVGACVCMVMFACVCASERE